MDADKVTLELTKHEAFLLEMAVDEVLWHMDNRNASYKDYEELDLMLHKSRKDVCYAQE